MLTCTLDGTALVELHSFRAKSPFFEFTVPLLDNVLGVIGVTGAFSGSDGYWLFLAPPQSGPHTISWAAREVQGPSKGFYQKLDYDLLVQ